MTYIQQNGSSAIRASFDLAAPSHTPAAVPPEFSTLDLTTLAAAYQDHAPAVHRTAYRLLGDASLADDAVQDAFLKLWTGTAQFDPARGTIRGFLLTIAHHTSIDVIRSRAAQLRVENVYSRDDAAAWGDGPECSNERDEELRNVRNAVSSLPLRQREVIEMAYFSELTVREIAQRIATPEGTVKSRLRLGKRKLARTLSGAPVRRTARTLERAI